MTPFIYTHTITGTQAIGTTLLCPQDIRLAWAHLHMQIPTVIWISNRKRQTNHAQPTILSTNLSCIHRDNTWRPLTITYQPTQHSQYLTTSPAKSSHILPDAATPSTMAITDILYKLSTKLNLLSEDDIPLDVAPAFKIAVTYNKQMQAIKDQLQRQGALPA